MRTLHWDCKRYLRKDSSALDRHFGRDLYEASITRGVIPERPHEKNLAMWALGGISTMPECRRRGVSVQCRI